MPAALSHTHCASLSQGSPNSMYASHSPTPPAPVAPPAPAAPPPAALVRRWRCGWWALTPLRHVARPPAPVAPWLLPRRRVTLWVRGRAALPRSWLQARRRRRLPARTADQSGRGIVRQAQAGVGFTLVHLLGPTALLQHSKTPLPLRQRSLPCHPCLGPVARLAVLAGSDAIVLKLCAARLLHPVAVQPLRRCKEGGQRAVCAQLRILPFNPLLLNMKV